MDIREMYQQMNGSYDKILHRLKSELMVRSFLEDFLEDEEYAKLEQAMEEQDYQAAFQAAHTLKGVTLNMELGDLAETAVALTDSLRHGKTDMTEPLYQTVREDYSKTVALIRELLAQ